MIIYFFTVKILKYFLNNVADECSDKCTGNEAAIKTCKAECVTKCKAKCATDHANDADKQTKCEAACDPKQETNGADATSNAIVMNTLIFVSYYLIE